MEVHGRDYEVEVRVRLHFKAAHSLPMRPELHLHDWEVEFSVSGPLDPGTGMVCDMLELHRFFKPYVERLDESNLHEIIDFQDLDGLIGLTAKFPTCDTLAHYFLWRTIPQFSDNPRFQGLRISQVKVSISEPDENEQWGHAVIRPKN